MFRLLSLIIFIIDSSSSRIVDWHISNNFKILFTLYATSNVGKVVAFVSQKPRSPRDNVILYGSFLYICSEIISEFVFFVFLMDEIVTRKNL